MTPSPTPSGAAPAAASTRPAEWGALLLLAAALTGPFLDKPFHIDDTFYLHVTRNIVDDPRDPYAGEIDWWHRPRPIWEGDSNPPLLNYLLAPVMARFGASEVALHTAMAPFVWLFVAGVWTLARRFTTAPWLAVAFAATSTGIVVSGNVMRDVPAAGLATAAIALFVSGSDRGDRRRLAGGSLLLGLACLTKYSALVLVPVTFGYALLYGRIRQLVWVAIPAACVGLWGVHNHQVYGEWHLFAQLGRAFNRPGHGWEDNFAAIPAVIGSLVYLAPAVLWHAGSRRDAALLAGCALAAAVAVGLIEAYTEGGAGLQFQLWNAAGAVLLAGCVVAALRTATDGDDRRDAAFLSAWLLVPLLFSSLSVPFQAVRHFLPALAPLVLLALRAVGARGAAPLLVVLLVVQVVVAFAVARVDAQTAAAYRDFAPVARERAEAAGVAPDARVWFLGHWGWMHYANAAGLRQLHVDGPLPAAGDALVVPRYVDKGRVLPRLPALQERLQQIDEVTIGSAIPLRTVHPAGAGFYALFTGRGPDGPSRVPYRYLPGAPLEVFEIWRVR